MPAPLSDTATGAGAGRSVLAVLVRHGESVWNAERRVQGQLGPGLTDTGARQASAAAEYLRRMFPAFDAAVSSDLPRVVETADAFELGSGLSVKRDPQWREIDTGAWSGLTQAEVRESFPDEVAASARGEDIARGGGETFAQLRARIAAALRGLAVHAADAAETRVAVFTHGGPITVAAAEALDLPPGGRLSLGAPINCSVTSIRLHLDDRASAVTRLSLDAYNTPTSELRRTPGGA